MLRQWFMLWPASTPMARATAVAQRTSSHLMLLTSRMSHPQPLPYPLQVLRDALMAGDTFVLVAVGIDLIFFKIKGYLASRRTTTTTTTTTTRT